MKASKPKIFQLKCDLKNELKPLHCSRLQHGKMISGFALGLFGGLMFIFLLYIFFVYFLTRPLTDDARFADAQAISNCWVATRQSDLPAINKEMMSINCTEMVKQFKKKYQVSHDEVFFKPLISP